MKHQTRILLALLIFALSINARAQQASTSQTRAADRMLSDESFTQGIDAMYNLDFEEARKRFEEVRQRFPDHPAGLTISPPIELTARYPRSYLFKLAEADAFVLQAAAARRTKQAAAASMEREAFAIFDSLLSSQAALRYRHSN